MPARQQPSVFHMRPYLRIVQIYIHIIAFIGSMKDAFGGEYGKIVFIHPDFDLPGVYFAQHPLALFDMLDHIGFSLGHAVRVDKDHTVIEEGFELVEGARIHEGIFFSG